MAQPRIDRGRRRSAGSRATRITLLVVLFLLLVGARTLASYGIEVEWWKEMGQFRTWLSMMYYSLAPILLGTLVCFAALWITHARALKFAGTGLSEHPLYSRASTLGLLLLGWLISASAIDTWAVVRFAGSRDLPAVANTWHDVVFAKPLSFYLFDLPFYVMLRSYVLAVVIFCILLYWVAARGWQLRYRLSSLNEVGIDPNFFRLEGGLESRFLRGAAVFLLLALALRYYLARYEMLYNEHGSFMVGADYVDLNVGLPMQWLMIVACIACAGLVWFGRWVLAASMALALPISFLAPRAVAALYVRPNEISLERPYIDSHIHATRSAYGLEQHVREMEYKAHSEAPIDVAANRATLDNVRLWDWQAYRDTITQIQALRPYYEFPDADVDRYQIEGQIRQVLLSPRELDLSKLPAARANWINPAFIYTHGYGVVLAEANRITADGLPVMLIENAPPEVKIPSLKLTRPELYYGEATHEPVFVHTTQEEFNYPSGERYEPSRYEGKGGFAISSFPLRVAAAIREGEAGILLTNYLKGESRMMIHRNVRDRLTELAGFLEWDTDPYLVITQAGRLVWMVDGYTTSDAHPYSRAVESNELGHINYIRNAVKATVDAYDGETRLYIFAPDDPIINSYQHLFPDLFRPASEMPADLRAHARYPEMLFRVQAEIFRTYHMLDPQSFYNKEDLWDLAQRSAGQGQGGTEPVTPTYIVATLPGEQTAEFLLLIPFTPRNKNNLIGLMVARCDGEHLGELRVLQLSKQELIYGPLQISARIDQDQVISKDLSLWNTQGSHVIRSQTLVLPVGDTFLYVEPVYIQANQASMPQLKKVVLAVGDRLIYTDTYDEALKQLSPGAAERPSQTTSTQGTSASTSSQAAANPPPGADARLDRVRDHLRRYRDLASQGRWSEAGKELEAIEAEVKR
jgi:uncharacterized membrane protein (UPF0182 family)